jgi:hypothetical protein
VSSVYVGSSVGDWVAGRCILDGVMGCIYGCGRRCRWLNVAVRNEPGLVCVHAQSSSFPSRRSAMAQKG